jgi:D-sedoheptulose 7-phosphate isomerase
MNSLDERFNELIDLLPVFKNYARHAIERSAEEIAVTFKKGHKILICGNGGSAADSQHFAAEFVNKFSDNIKRKALPALALTTDTSIITAISNDSNYENIFSRQIEAYGGKGDLVIIFTTSGNSVNCLEAIKTARSIGLNSIVFTKIGAEISKLADLSIEVPSTNTQHIQECHVLAYHVITELVENTFRGENNE